MSKDAMGMARTWGRNQFIILGKNNYCQAHVGRLKSEQVKKKNVQSSENIYRGANRSGGLH